MLKSNDSCPSAFKSLKLASVLAVNILCSAYALLNVMLVYHSVSSEKYILSLTSESFSKQQSFHFILAAVVSCVSLYPTHNNPIAPGVTY